MHKRRCYPILSIFFAGYNAAVTSDECDGDADHKKWSANVYTGSFFALSLEHKQWRMG